MKIYGVQITFKEENGETWEHTYPLMFKEKAEAEAYEKRLTSDEEQKAILAKNGQTIYESQITEYILIN